MDEELKKYLDERFETSDRRFHTRIDDAFTHWSQHILNEVGSRFNEVNTRLESIDARLKLQAGLIQSGAGAMARFSEIERIPGH